jgi:hypothetical protein
MRRNIILMAAGVSLLAVCTTLTLVLGNILSPYFY